MKADQETKQAVNAVLEKMAQAMAARDITAFIKLFANDAIMVTLGLEERDINIGIFQLKERMQGTFTEAEAISLKYGWTTIKANGPVAWVASHITYNIKKKEQEALSLSTRLTGVLEKTDGKWLWVQLHFSMARNIAEAAKAAEAGTQEEPAKEEEAPAKEEETGGFYELP
jgi:uncharacterized protein (TIGR02246 family)